MSKTNQQLIEEFLANGGKIEVLEPVLPIERNIVGSTSKKIPQIMTLSEGELMFAKQEKKKKVKTPDYSNINMDLIPEHLKKLLKVEKPAKDNTTKEKSIETN